MFEQYGDPALVELYQKMYVIPSKQLESMIVSGYVLDIRLWSEDSEKSLTWT